jgi:BirA family biotin operon repressor/biotin-[acetyl-CoA-carboxylase] ligase
VAVLLPSGARLEVFERLDSTSFEARRRADAGRRNSVFLVALEQTSGYGRRGTAWLQQPGDFAGTLLFSEDAPADTLGQLAFVAGLAAYDAIAAYAPSAELSLKWPNDVLAEGGKIAGMLIELLDVKPGRPSLLALGLGVNIVSRPEVADYPTSRLLDFSGAAPPRPADFADAFDRAFAAWRGLWRGKGFAPIRFAWLERAAYLGATITVRAADGDATGRFADLDPAGALVLDCDGTRRSIAAGAILQRQGA